MIYLQVFVTCLSTFCFLGLAWTGDMYNATLLGIVAVGNAWMLLERAR